MYEYLINLSKILSIAYNKEYLVGSPRYGWSTYKIPMVDVTCEYHALHYKNGEELFELHSDEFLVSAKRVSISGQYWPGAYSPAPILIDQVNIYWNDRLIKETKSKKAEYKTYIEYVGSLSAIKETVTMLSLIKEY